MIPANATNEEIGKLISRRYQWSKRWHQPWHQKWVRFYKIWRNLADKVSGMKPEEAEEPNSFIPYAFSMVEDLHAKSVEPMLRMGLPARPRAKRPGDGKAAENFGSMARTYFTSPTYQLDFMAAGKERVITGTMWERDEWLEQWSTHKRWAKVPGVDPKTGAEVATWQLVDDRQPDRVGYSTAFPSAFLVHPEPGVKDARRLAWLIEEEPSVTVADLQAAMFVDPVTKKEMPVFDMDELLKESKGGDPNVRIRPVDPMGAEYPDYYAQARSIVATEGDSRAAGGSDDDGLDRVHVLRHFDKTGHLVFLAQGKFVIARVQLPVSRIPHRTRVYTVDPHFINGVGGIEPVEDLVYELNDSHNLAFANWLRIINRILAINTAAMVDEDDLDTRPYGPWRFNGSVHQAIAQVQVQDVAPSLLAMESNAKGLMERATAAADLSPGVSGTKQDHDTATGVLEIQRNMTARLAMMRRVDLAAYQDQLWMMERFYSFYLWRPMPFTVYGPDGATVTAELSHEDIYTDGRGFDYIIEHDPAFGDESIQRQYLMLLWEQGLRYEDYRLKTGDAEMPRFEVVEVMKRIGKTCGFEDSSMLFKALGGVLDPDMELQAIVGGAEVPVNPMENFIQHMMRHYEQRVMVSRAVAEGKQPAAVLALLDAHIAMTVRAIQAVMQDPARAAELYKAKAAMGAAPMAAGGAGGQA